MRKHCWGGGRGRKGEEGGERGERGRKGDGREMGKRTVPYLDKAFREVS